MDLEGNKRTMDPKKWNESTKIMGDGEQMGGGHPPELQKEQTGG